jgi:hypothetical protein
VNFAFMANKDIQPKRSSDIYKESESNLLNTIKKNISGIKKHFHSKFRECYSQCGEDLILNRIFRDKTNGFYVDVGANNPFEQSNTHFFYKLGWNGINIDALPGSMKVFETFRPRDINLEMPISDTKDVLKYYLFETSFFNGFSPDEVVLANEKLLEIKEIKPVLLSEVFDSYLKSSTIDFMTVDVEGWDMNVLKSNNWNKYRPNVLIIEMTDIPAPLISSTEMGAYMLTIGYQFFCNTSTNALFFEKEFYYNYLRMYNNDVLEQHDNEE